MKTDRTSSFLSSIGSVKLTLVLLIVLAVVTGAATLIESAYGTTYAQATVYRARWFEALLILFALNMIVMFVLRWSSFERRQIGFIITHFSVIVILIGAGVTRFFGYEGIMSIREGSSSSFIYSRENYVLLSLGGESVHAPVTLYKAGPQKIRRHLELEGETFNATVTEYWPHMTHQLQESAEGEPMISLTVATRENAEALHLKVGVTESIANTDIQFHGSGSLPELSNNERGTLHVSLGDETGELDIPAELPAELRVGGQMVRVTERDPDFKVGRDARPDAPMKNPALQLEVVGSDGQVATRQIFALHPEFTMGDSLTGAARELEISYVWSRSVHLSLGSVGEVQMIANFPVGVVAAGKAASGSDHRVAKAGTVFTLDNQASVETGSFGMRLEGAWSSAVWGPVASGSENDPAAARIELHDEQGNSAEEIVFIRRGKQKVRLGDRDVLVSIGPITIPVDYRIQLDDFVLVTYPGSNNPASYESHVRLFDPERGIDGQKVRIYMNHPLTYRGFKHFQSSYDSDRRGTVLSVNHDPGKWPTYIGYILMTLGFLITMSRGVLWNRHPARHIGTTVLAVMLLGAAAPTWAQEHDHSAEPQIFLSESTRDQARLLIAQDYQGRMKPLDTFAREMAVKVTKQTHFEGWDPVDLYLSWIAQPRYWFDEPIIAVRNEGVKQMLGVDPSVRRVSAASLHDTAGKYILEDELEATRRTPDRDRSKAQRKLLAFDERVNLLLLSLQGQTFRIFPVPEDDNNRWLGASIFSNLNADQRTEFQTPYQQLTEAVAHADDASAAEALESLASIQAGYGAEVIPPDSRVRAELWLNEVNPFLKVMLPYAFALVLLGFGYVWGLARREDPRYPLRHPLYATGMVIYLAAIAFHIFGYVLRWNAQSHAPLSNGYESLIFISVLSAVAGLYYETRDRRGSTGALASLLTLVILGVALLPTFDPSISPIVPVLASYWLIIHVSVITASYSFLGLAALMGMTVLILHLFKGPDRIRIRRAILEMNGLLWRVLVAGLALLSIGTLLGGVWANESWGRYWGWDPKETWSLVTILVYAAVIHFRYIPALNQPWILAAASFTAISSVIMTYLGVNYLLSGLHSYGSGESSGMPTWVYVTSVFMLILLATSYRSDRTRSWK